MPKAVISDTSCLIVLAKIGKLDLLALVYGSILFTDAVAQEFNNTLPQWMQMMNPKDSHYQQILETQEGRKSRHHHHLRGRFQGDGWSWVSQLPLETYFSLIFRYA